MSQNEFTIPIASEEVYEEGGPRFIAIMPQVIVRIYALFVDGEDIPLAKSVTLTPAQVMRFPIPHKNPQQGGAYGEALMDGDKSVATPMAGRVCGPVRAMPLVIQPGTAIVTQHNVTTAGTEDAPITAAKFKRFDLTAEGDLTKLTLEGLRIGTNNYLVTSDVPAAMALRPTAFNVPDIIGTGVYFSTQWKNLGDQPITLTGNIVFERVDPQAYAEGVRQARGSRPWPPLFKHDEPPFRGRQ